MSKLVVRGVVQNLGLTAQRNVTSDGQLVGVVDTKLSLEVIVLEADKLVLEGGLLHGTVLTVTLEAE